MAIAVLPGLGKAESDRTTLLMVGKLVEELPALIVMGPLLVAAVIAATMSTIDSALLSISSMVSNDLYRPLRPDSSAKHLTKIGKVTSIVLMFVVVVLTIALQKQTIWRLLEIKLEILAQIAPAVMLGTQWGRLRARAVFAGALVGTGVAVWLTIAGWKPHGVHAGLWGLGANLITLLAVQGWGQKKPAGE